MRRGIFHHSENQLLLTIVIPYLECGVYNSHIHSFVYRTLHHAFCHFVVSGHCSSRLQSSQSSPFKFNLQLFFLQEHALFAPLLHSKGMRAKWLLLDFHFCFKKFRAFTIIPLSWFLIVDSLRKIFFLERMNT